MLFITTSIQLFIGGAKGQLNKIRKKSKSLKVIKEGVVILRSIFIFYLENLKPQEYLEKLFKPMRFYQGCKIQHKYSPSLVYQYIGNN